MKKRRRVSRYQRSKQRKFGEEMREEEKEEQEGKKNMGEIRAEQREDRGQC